MVHQAEGAHSIQQVFRRDVVEITSQSSAHRIQEPSGQQRKVSFQRQREDKVMIELMRQHRTNGFKEFKEKRQGNQA